MPDRTLPRFVRIAAVVAVVFGVLTVVSGGVALLAAPTWARSYRSCCGSTS